jgi:hypothetical protein
MTKIKSLKLALVAGGFITLTMINAPLANYHFAIENFDIISSAQAAEDGDSGKKKSGKAQGGSSGDHGTTKGSGKGKKDVMMKGQGGASEDSDRPTTAGVKGGKGGGGLASSGTKKGDLYGDLFVLLRDPVTGAPILNTAGQVQPLDGNGNLIPLNADGTPVDASKTVEVEFGRLSVSRSPSKVSDHSLAEALSKLQAATTTNSVSLDVSGRLQITTVVDGVTVSKAIDSPLENLALYKAIANLTGTNRTISITSTAKDGSAPVTSTWTVPSAVNIDQLKASLLAAAGDKTGVITLETVMRLNPIVGVTDDLSAVSYDRKTTYDGKMVTVLVKQPDGVTYVATPVDLYTAVFNRVNDTTSNGAADFATSVNDSLQVLEYVHDNEVR